MAWPARVLSCVLLSVLSGCGGQGEELEAGVGSSRDSCGADESHSYPVGEHSCTCEAGYAWCTEALEEFECCPIEAEAEDGDGDGDSPPELPCDASLTEQLVCLTGPADDGGLVDPGTGVVWACNGERWVEVPGYATFACMAEGFEFAYGCVPGPSFVCGYGPGSPCDPTNFAGICVDAEIIDTCVWGRRTIDRCSRLCAELAAFGPGFVGGACEELEPEPAACVCQ